MERSTRSRAQNIALLERTYPLVDAWDQGDDWTGVTGTKERKKRQNRINQRAYRRRNIAKQVSSKISATTVSSSECAFSPLKAFEEETTLPDGSIILTCSRQIAQFRTLLRSAYEEYCLGAPRPTSLPMIIRLNLINALVRNARMIGFPPDGLCRDEYESPFRTSGPLVSCPEALKPTTAQRNIRHHPWIDLFPFPAFRDNFLLALDAGFLDEDELCMELLDVGAANLGDKPALIVWGDSSDFKGWEVNVPFLKKWGWLLRGCPELIEGTNHWRMARSEKTLTFPTS